MITSDDTATTTRRRLRRPVWLRIGFSVGAIVLLMLWILGAFKRDVIQAGQRPVGDESAAGLATYTVAPQAIASQAEAVGTVKPEQVATVSSRVVANILQVRVSAGERVAAGTILAVLDDRDLRHRLQQARDNVRSAEATLAQAQSDFARDQPLFDQQVISAYDFEHTRTNRETAQANLHRLQQAEREAEVTLSYAVIRSPFDGVVIDTLAVEGDLAAPGKSLVTIYERGRLWLEAAVPERLADRVRVGQPLTFRLDALGAAATGTVVEIVPASDPASRTVLVRVRVPDTAGVLAGMFGRLEIPTDPEPRLTVPARAIVHAGQLTMAEVVREGRVERRTVQLGRALGDRFEVLSGLASGEAVVLRGAPAAADDPVQADGR